MTFALLTKKNEGDAMYLQVMIMIHPDLHGVNPNSIPLATAFTFTIARGILFWHYELAGF